ncbi:hypothetical protein A2914_00450 [Candidatus Nomurabacteria bacterium RIFCSPLOWO2_01_FULL_41_21]|uniref:Galactose oxidase n=2 Tax=Candidatus Nomuraibacteriota TaxID=1752729 RepID=A0A1F6V3Y6_9BACT|nr:MAG: hypothetical protein A2733_02810 [Candidatus Nomurabacteria bacterium RIFCSPHIGHO2_01_FULL_40_20]OGI88316.1 MAG: hypothetical protein A2914_00450 [Candidatus Nomurabacteria bacterium RIFCSPLOWO2_01_FULL_41_21]
MKKSIISFIVLGALVFSVLQINPAKTVVAAGCVANTWVEKAYFGGPIGSSERTEAAGFSIGTTGYIGTGVRELTGIDYKKNFWAWDQTTDTWTQKADFGGVARSGAVGFSINGKGYMGIGYNSLLAQSLLKDFWEYNPTTNIWTQKTDFGGGVRAYATGFAIGAMGYIGTGWSGPGGTEKDFWQYDPATDKWTQKTNFGGIERRGATGFSITTSGRGYIGTGSDSMEINLYKDFWEYNPTTDAWTQKTDFGGVARNLATSFAIGSKGYLGTGQGASSLLRDFWTYDSTTDKWTQKADFGGTARKGAVGFSIDDRGYTGTGSNTRDFWEYCGEEDNCTPNTWTQKADFGGVERSYATGFSVGGKGYMGTGRYGSTNQFFEDFWEYNPLANTWTQKADYGGDLVGSATSFSIGSKGYTGTGTGGGSNYRKDFWQYDPVINYWNQKADFGGVGRFGAVSFSIDSKGYIGTGLWLQTRKDFWEYDSLANTWTQKADFGGTARLSAVSFSLANKGYIGTGDDFSGQYQKDFWEWNQATNTWVEKADFGGGDRSYATSFSISGKGYAGLGQKNYGNAVIMKDFWQYDPATDAWTQKADFGGVARYGATGFSVGDRGYIGTGRINLFSQSLVKDFWEYCPD